MTMTMAIIKEQKKTKEDDAVEEEEEKEEITVDECLFNCLSFKIWAFVLNY